MRRLPYILNRLRYAALGRPRARESFAASLAAVFGSAPEVEVHPHVPEERADLFRSVDSGSTELEVLDALHAFVRLFKPTNVLETGTWHGFGAIALAAAVRRNGVGRVTSVDTSAGALKLARRHVTLYDPRLFDVLSFELADSHDFLARYDGPPFDFVFLDSAMDTRADEFSALEARGLFAPGAVCVVHDTSPHRPNYTPLAGSTAEPEIFSTPIRNVAVFRDAIARHQGFEFPLSRGFHFVRIVAGE